MKYYLLLVVFFMYGCNQYNQQPGSTQLKTSNAIIGELNWYPLSTYSDDSPEYVAGQVVGALVINDTEGYNHYCTGTIVGKNLVLTNNHCVPRPNAFTSITFTIQDKDYDCYKYIIGDVDLDYSLLLCHGSPGAAHGIVKTAASLFAPKNVFVVHANCDYLSNPNCSTEILVSSGRIKNSIGNIYFHTADTLPGSSGGAVFDVKNGKMIALHFGSNGAETKNKATPILSVLAHIKRHAPWVKLETK